MTGINSRKRIPAPVKAGLYILLFGIIIFLGQLKVEAKYKNLIYAAKDVPCTETGLILGATVWDNTIPCDILADRLLVGIRLYQLGKIRKIIVSGAKDAEYYDEVRVMKDFLLEKGISQADILTDEAGYTTYDSLYRAQQLFNPPALIIITNRFHLPRALYIARELGIEASGVESDLRKYTSEMYNSTREFFARIKANIDLIFQPRVGT